MQRDRISSKSNACLTEASLWDGDYSTFLCAPASVYVTYKLYKSIIESLGTILFSAKGENKHINQIIKRIETNKDEYRDELIREIQYISKRPIDELDEDDVIELCTKLLEKHGSIYNGIPLLCTRMELKPDAAPVEPGSNYYSPSQFNYHIGGTGINEDNPSAAFVRVYKKRAFDAIRTVPAMLIGLFSGLIMNNDARVQYYMNMLKKLATWSGSWRRALDDIINGWDENWKCGNVSQKPSSQKAVSWLKKQTSDERHPIDEWNTILPKRNTRLADAVGSSRFSDD